MIDGALDWQRNGLVRPQKVINETNEYFAAQDLLGQFIDEECETDEHGLGSYRSILSGDLYSAWVTYTKAAGEPPGSHKAFGDEVEQRGFPRKKGGKGKRWLMGIKLTTEARYRAMEGDDHGTGSRTTEF